MPSCYSQLSERGQSFSQKVQYERIEHAGQGVRLNGPFKPGNEATCYSYAQSYFLLSPKERIVYEWQNTKHRQRVTLF